MNLPSANQGQPKESLTQKLKRKAREATDRVKETANKAREQLGSKTAGVRLGFSQAETNNSQFDDSKYGIGPGMDPMTGQARRDIGNLNLDQRRTFEVRSALELITSLKNAELIAKQLKIVLFKVYTVSPTFSFNDLVVSEDVKEGSLSAPYSSYESKIQAIASQIL